MMCRRLATCRLFTVAWLILSGVVIAPSVRAADTLFGLLPHGYLSTSGSQIVDESGRPVRIAAVGWPGGDSDLAAPIGLNRVNYRTTMAGIKSLGFNTIRLPWCDIWVGVRADTKPLKTPRAIAIDVRYNPELDGLTSLQVTDRLVGYAGEIGLKIIFDHHNSECQSGQQSNGLWFDRKITPAQFEQDWIQLARRYHGNDTVIGFDLHNEPLLPAQWGGGGMLDWHAEATRLGGMLQAINPGPLIIVAGIINLRPAPNMPDLGQEGNLEGVRSLPVVLTVPNKVVYTVHEYPPSVFDFTVNRNPTTLVPHMNQVWGFVVTDGIAPVWIGEMGSSLEGRSESEVHWAKALLDYMDGSLWEQGGPRFSGAQQGIGGSWWFWGHMDDWTPNGLLASWSGTPRPAQYAIVRRMLTRR